VGTEEATKREAGACKRQENVNVRGIGDGYIEVERSLPVSAGLGRVRASMRARGRTSPLQPAVARRTICDHGRRERAGRGDRGGGGSLFGCGEEGSWAGAMPQGRRNASAPAPVTDEPSPNMAPAGGDEGSGPHC